jgi:DNA-binding NtrC family response regulator
MLVSGHPQVERLAITILRRALRASGGNASRAAQALGVSRETLYECRARSAAVARLMAAKPCHGGHTELVRAEPG